MSIPLEKLFADFLTQGEAAAELRVCKRTLDRWRKLDERPPLTKLGRRTLYRRSSTQAWPRARARVTDTVTTAQTKVEHSTGERKHAR